MTLRLAGAAALVFALTVLPASAHHAVQAQFDTSKVQTLDATITKIEWVNPHSYMFVDVKDASGSTKKWLLELAGVGALSRAGLRRGEGAMKVGMLAKITIVLARDGTDSGLVKQIEFPDGRKVVVWSGDPNNNE